MHLIPTSLPDRASTSRPARRDPGNAASAAFLEASLPLITHVVKTVCSRHRVGAEDAREVLSALLLKMVDNDYAVVRRFDGRSDFKTYMYTVAHRFLLDYRNSQWGKWRPSAEARRGGVAAMRVERLVVRDGFSLHEAVQSVATVLAMPVEEVAAIADRLRLRVSARRMFEYATAAGPAVVNDADARVCRAAMAAEARRVRDALASALATLGADDRGLLRLRFVKGLSIARIARFARVEQKRMYRRFDGILRGLRDQLERQGIRVSDLATVLGHQEVDISSLLGDSMYPVTMHGLMAARPPMPLRPRNAWMALGSGDALEERRAAASGA